ncbi:ATPase PAAT-like isoform X1 [Ursus americanus]|uniref:ATPase PAAT-like isoform X1 n=1 Tax=Ursus americanus TaxID=9643 RepID=UPI001E67D00D|nr:ATPase PAAT-like isoform X1 [Ursus americanus]
MRVSGTWFSSHWTRSGGSCVFEACRAGSRSASSPPRCPGGNASPGREVPGSVWAGGGRMETGAEDAGLSCSPMLASSWDAACGALTHSLHLTRADLGARDLDWEEPLAPPAPGQDLVVLKSSLSSPGEKPCFLYLRCDPNGGEEIVSVGILSSARNMEVYLGEEYCGTSRGKTVCGDPENSEHKIIFYKKYLKLESSSDACKIKLLSFGEKQCVFISKIVVQLKRVSANSSTSSPALGSRIDLQRVQTLMEAMGSKLSPGAQQLMNMVKFQQQNCVPTGEQLQSVWGNTGHKRMVDLQSSSASGAPDKSPSTPFPFRTGLTSGNGTEDLKASIDKSPQPPGGGNITNLKEYNIVPQNHSLLENDLRNAVSSLLPKKASDSSSIPKSELLPFLQNLCSQVNHLRVGHDARWQEGITKAGEGVVAVAMEEQPVCACLEKILTKNMELMEKKLVDYIDQRLSKLQEHMDARMALLADLLRSPSSPPPGPALRQWDSGERLSNGER